MAKLTQKDVEEIWAAKASGKFFWDAVGIARRLGVTKGAVEKVGRGASWSPVHKLAED